MDTAFGHRYSTSYSLIMNSLIDRCYYERTIPNIKSVTEWRQSADPKAVDTTRIIFSVSYYNTKGLYKESGMYSSGKLFATIKYKFDTDSSRIKESFSDRWPYVDKFIFSKSDFLPILSISTDGNKSSYDTSFYFYDKDGRLSLKIFNVYEEVFIYDSLNRLSQIEHYEQLEDIKNLITITTYNYSLDNNDSINTIEVREFPKAPYVEDNEAANKRNDEKTKYGKVVFKLYFNKRNEIIKKIFYSNLTNQPAYIHTYSYSYYNKNS